MRNSPAPATPARDRRRDRGLPRRLDPGAGPRWGAIAGAFALVACLAPTRVAAAAPPAAQLDGDAEGPAPRPPRINGPYVGGVVSGAGAFTSLQNIDTPGPFNGFLLSLRAGDVVLPWLSLGVEFVGGAGWAPGRRVAQGGLLMDFGFMPVPRVPFSLRAGFGFGAGAAVSDQAARRDGFGGALFKAGARYEFFPTAERRRPRRGGGWAIGPELGWLGFPPNAPDGPSNHVITLGIWSGMYFGD